MWQDIWTAGHGIGGIDSIENVTTIVDDMAASYCAACGLGPLCFSKKHWIIALPILGRLLISNLVRRDTEQATTTFALRYRSSNPADGTRTAA